jgi:hypothetical protein
MAAIRTVREFGYADFENSLCRDHLQEASDDWTQELVPIMKKNVLIIGAGGVAQVVAHKCAQNNDVLGDINIASRTKAKCDAIIASSAKERDEGQTACWRATQLDAHGHRGDQGADQVDQLQIVINVGTAFLNMSVLRACLDTGAAYIDTAIHEEPGKICETPPWYANYEWKRADEAPRRASPRSSAPASIRASSTPMRALAKNDYLDKVTDVDIVDINAGSHGKYSPPISIRKSTSANSPARSIPGRTANGRPTRCSRSARPMTCRWSAPEGLSLRP